jgi:hypothetical protein
MQGVTRGEQQAGGYRRAAMLHPAVLLELQAAMSATAIVQRHGPPTPPRGIVLHFGKGQHLTSLGPILLSTGAIAEQRQDGGEAGFPIEWTDPSAFNLPTLGGLFPLCIGPALRPVCQRLRRAPILPLSGHQGPPSKDGHGCYTSCGCSGYPYRRVETAGMRYCCRLERVMHFKP